MKVLIVGLGSIAKKHIAALFSINKDVKVYALRSNSNKNNVDGVANIYDLSDWKAQAKLAAKKDVTTAPKTVVNEETK